ncbi:unnamed protein product [Linum tenue]|uniref:Uncharacterized protein n=1 Tax=Linum tenue TaxID=586396 RepID=A0AAV0QXI0_9ROSI|nr:unnamed protein product [Linum tenue]
MNLSNVSDEFRIGDELLHLGRPWVVEPHGGVHELNYVPFASFQNLIQFPQINGAGLLHQQMLLLLRYRHSPPRVLPHRQRYEDCVHVRIVDDFFMAAAYPDRLRQLVCDGELLGFFRGGTGNGVKGGGRG